MLPTMSAPLIHTAAVIATITVHGALVVWSMQPTAPLLMPDQQLIKISMVAPSASSQKKMIPAVKPAKKKSPLEKKVGMVKAKKSADKKMKPKLKPRKLASLQSQNSIETRAAITKPIPANYLNNPEPHYPLRARRKGYQGTVLLDVIVKTDGSPKLVKLLRSSGHEILDNTALETVKNWKFVPARRGAKYVEAGVEVPITFRIN